LGVNAAGLAVCVNTVRALPAATDGLPVAFVIKELLMRRNAAAAADYPVSIPPTRQAETFCAAEFLLTVPPAVRVAPGRPDQTPWQTIGWNSSPD
jgi:hypothetical protein